MNDYILLYGDKKPEDNICIKNMFDNNMQINLGWTDFDYNHNMKIIESKIQEGVQLIIFSGVEIGWDKLIKDVKCKYPNLKIKVICNTADSLLYYEYERENFFKLLELSKAKVIDDIGFLRKSQYEVYKSIGYKCSYIMQNYNLKQEYKKVTKKKNDIIDIGIYPLNYVWDKNIFNQMCISKFVKNSNLNYNRLDERMQDFAETMQIKSVPCKIEKIEEKEIIKEIIKNDVLVLASFTEYMHPVFWLGMELGIPCIIGNTSDLFQENDELKNFIVTDAEDNAIINSKKVEECYCNSKKIIELYKKWKEQYDIEAKNNIKSFIEN